MRKTCVIVGWIAVALLVAWCAVASVSQLRRGQREGYESRSVAAWRTLAREVPSTDVGFLCKNKDDLKPLDRTHLIAVNWELGDRPARAITEADVENGPSVILASSHCARRTRKLLARCGYRVIVGHDMVEAWSREPVVKRDAAAATNQPSRVREWIVVAILLALFALGVVRAGRLSVKGRIVPVLAICLFVVLSYAALSHPLLAPNGLGVQAGKAKLFLLADGVPDGFWTDPRYAVYQPSYPPGLSLLSALCFCLTGGFGDVLIQLFVPGALALLFLALTGDGRDRLVTCAALCATMCPLAQHLTAGFYAEPFAALCLAVGLRRVGVLRDERGWWMVGLAALFRHEGLLVAFGFAAMLADGSLVRRLRCVVFAALPGVCWQLFCRLTGAGLESYAWENGPSVSHVLLAGRVMWSQATIEAAGCGAVAVGSAALVIRERFRRTGFVRLRLFAAAVLTLVAGVVLLGFNTSLQFEWIANGTLPRYLWLVFVPTLLSCHRRDRDSYSPSNRHPSHP